VTGTEPSAADRFKDIMAEITEAADRLREADRRRAEELKQRLLGLEDDMLRTGERARLTDSVVQLHWERALDLLWAESWMKLRPRPEPDPRVDPARLEDYDTEVHRRSDMLREVVRRRWYEFGRR
jgi:hypothetical protein